MALQAAKFRRQARSRRAQFVASELRSELSACGHSRHLLDAAGPLLDQLACVNGQNAWHSETKRLGCREIDDQLKFGRLLDRYFAGFCTAQNLVHKLGCATEHVLEVWSVGHETTGLDEVAVTEHRRQ